MLSVATSRVCNIRNDYISHCYHNFLTFEHSLKNKSSILLFLKGRVYARLAFPCILTLPGKKMLVVIWFEIYLKCNSSLTLARDVSVARNSDPHAR